MDESQVNKNEMVERAKALIAEFAEQSFGYWRMREVEIHAQNNTIPVGSILNSHFPGLTKDLLLVMGDLSPEFLDRYDEKYMDELIDGLQDLTQMRLFPSRHVLESYLTIELAAKGWDMFRVHRYISSIYSRVISTTYYASNQRVLISAEVMALLKQLNKRTDMVRLSGNKLFVAVDILPQEK